jgi:hypothetical protein
VANADVTKSAEAVALDEAMMREHRRDLADDAHIMRETVRANVQVMRLGEPNQRLHVRAFGLTKSRPSFVAPIAQVGASEMTYCPPAS